MPQREAEITDAFEEWFRALKREFEWIATSAEHNWTRRGFGAGAAFRQTEIDGLKDYLRDKNAIIENQEAEKRQLRDVIDDQRDTIARLLEER